MVMFFFILCNLLGRNCHQSDATTTTYQTTRAVIKRQPGAAHVPSAHNSRNNPSIRWARDVLFHYTTPGTVRSSLAKQWARQRSGQRPTWLWVLPTDVANDAERWSPRKETVATKKKGRGGGRGAATAPTVYTVQNIQHKLEIYSLLDTQCWHLASQKATLDQQLERQTFILSFKPVTDGENPQSEVGFDGIGSPCRRSWPGQQGDAACSRIFITQ